MIAEGFSYQLYLGDCLQIMRGMEPGSVDGLIVDPPFGIGFKYSTHKDTPRGYGRWVWSTIKKAESKLVKGSPVFVWQAMPNARHFKKWFPRKWRIFAACKNFVQMRPTAMQYSFDPVLVWWTDGERYSAGTNSRDYHIGNTSPASHVGMNDGSGHPCPRPLDQMRHIIEQWVRPGGLVLDPFMGSGTTGVACMQLGRRFVGCEIDPAYFAIAKRRIEQAAAQPLLIFPTAPKPKQTKFA